MDDPAYGGVKYSYSVTANGKQYELSSIYESGEFAGDFRRGEGLLVPYAMAASQLPSASAIVRGTYNRVLVPVADSLGTTRFIASPSITLADLSKTDLSQGHSFSTGAFVVEKMNNVPSNYAPYVSIATGYFSFVPKLV
jgi:hypothetical protein